MPAPTTPTRSPRIPPASTAADVPDKAPRASFVPILGVVIVVPRVVQALAQCVGTGVLLASDDIVVVVNDEFLGLFDAFLTSPVGERLDHVAAREPFRQAPELWAARHGERGRRRRCHLPGDRVVDVRWHTL